MQMATQYSGAGTPPSTESQHSGDRDPYRTGAVVASLQIDLRSVAAGLPVGSELAASMLGGIAADLPEQVRTVGSDFDRVIGKVGDPFSDLSATAQGAVARARQTSIGITYRFGGETVQVRSRERDDFMIAVEARLLREGVPVPDGGVISRAYSDARARALGLIEERLNAMVDGERAGFEGRKTAVKSQLVAEAVREYASRVATELTEIRKILKLEPQLGAVATGRYKPADLSDVWKAADRLRKHLLGARQLEQLGTPYAFLVGTGLIPEQEVLADRMRRIVQQYPGILEQELGREVSRWLPR
jgi:hypothetical protein